MSKDYWQMVGAWEAIIAQSLPDQAKQEACLAVLRDYVDRKAFARVRQPNPALRFYADMLTLQNDIGPRFTKENDLERFALWPLSRLVFDWVKRHTEPVSVRPIA
jgi:hypothetical protein